jgi:glycosyltransferase involved in cell wall biosynthesis
MRILILAPFAAGGSKGTTRWRVLPLARALAAEGHTVRVLIPPYDWPRCSGLSWQDHGVAVDNLTLPPSGGPSSYLMLARALARAAAAWQPDVVHCFKPKGPAGLAAWFLKHLPGWRAPLVMDADDWEEGWNRQAGYPLAWQIFFRWQEHWGLRRAEAVTAASRWLADYACGLRDPATPAAVSGNFGVYYVPNGVDPPGVFPTHRPAAETKTVLVYTRFVEHSPQLLWRVWLKVFTTEPQTRLVVAGPRPGGETEWLVDAARNTGISHSLSTTGWVPSACRAGLFAAADVAVLPVLDTPLNRAKSPMRLMDLLAAGVPVATQNVGEYGGVVSDGVTGLVEEPGNDQALATAVVRLLKDPWLGDRLGRGAAARMRTEYSWPRLSQRVLRAYEEVLSRVA